MTTDEKGNIIEQKGVATGGKLLKKALDAREATESTQGNKYIKRLGGLSNKLIEKETYTGDVTLEEVRRTKIHEELDERNRYTQERENWNKYQEELKKDEKIYGGDYDDQFEERTRSSDLGKTFDQKLDEITEHYEKPVKMGQELFLLHYQKDILTRKYEQIKDGTILRINSYESDIEIIEDPNDVEPNAILYVNGINNTNKYACLTLRLLSFKFQFIQEILVQRAKIKEERPRTVYMVYNANLFILADLWRGAKDGAQTYVTPDVIELYKEVFKKHIYRPPQDDMQAPDILKKNVFANLKRLFESGKIEYLICHSNGNPTAMSALIESKSEKKLATYFGVAPALNDDYYINVQNKISEYSSIYVNSSDTVILGATLKAFVWSALKFFYRRFGKKSVNVSDLPGHNFIDDYHWAIDDIIGKILTWD